MNQSDLIIDGIQLMLIGMSMVFVFLSILVFCTSYMQKIFVETPEKQRSDTTDKQISDEEIAAISSAVHQYRQKNSKD